MARDSRFLKVAIKRTPELFLCVAACYCRSSGKEWYFFLVEIEGGGAVSGC